jgi:pimeloyl-ACP methyl ester carboxylesterase
MSGIESSSVAVGGEPCRVLTSGAGAGETVGYLGGLKGVPTWLPFLDELARSRRVVVPSLPGFPGGAPNSFRDLDDQLDWVAATLDLLEGAGLAGCDLIASSFSAMLAADVAAYAPGFVRRLVLIGPWGLYDTSDPGTDYFAKTEQEQAALLSSDPALVEAALAPPPGADELEWSIETYHRANEAAARVSWPFGDRGLRKRLHRITVPTLVIWGEQDRVLPAAYAKRFEAGITGPTTTVTIPDCAHDCAINAPDQTVKHVLQFLAAG